MRAGADALVWLLAAPVGWWPRIRELLLAGRRDAGQRGLVGAVVELWPADSRPVHRRLAEQQRAGAGLRLQRLRPADRRRDRQRRRQPRRWLGADGHHAAVRLRDGRQGAWLLPAALVLLGVLVVARARLRAPTALRAALVLWGGWLLVTGLVFSYMAGIIHPYYTVALAPAVAALVGIGVARAVAATGATPTSRRDAGRGARADGRLGLRTCWPQHDLAAVADAGPCRSPGWPAVAGLLGVHRMPRAAVVAVATVALVAGAGGLDRVRAGDRGDPAHRRDPVGRPGGCGPDGRPAAGCAAARPRRRRVRAARQPPGGRRRPARNAEHRARPADGGFGARRRGAAARAASSAPPRPAPSSRRCWSRTPAPTPGSPPPSAPTTPRATSSPPTSR